MPWHQLQQRYQRAIYQSTSPCPSAVPVLPTQLRFVLLAGTDAAERGWVGDDLGLDAKRVPGMNAESTAHCLRAEMPALCHVGLPAQRDNPFSAAPGEEGKEGRQDLSVPQHSSQRIP